MTPRTKKPEATLANQIPTKKPSTPASEPAQTFLHHIKELRQRLFFVVIAGLLVGTAVYYYHDFFVTLVMAPLNGQKLVYLTPAGGFSFVFMVTFYATLVLILPVIIYQLYAFIKPAIPAHTGRLSVKIIAAATLLMAAGAAFGYFVAVPAGLNFLNNFAEEYVTASLTAESYLSFVLGYVLGIGALFELPLLLLFWHWMQPLTPKGLWNSERFVIVGAFIAAAVLSPSPDALSQAIIAIPIILVYQLGVIAVLISIKRAKRRQLQAPLQEEQLMKGVMEVLLEAKARPALELEPEFELEEEEQKPLPERIAIKPEVEEEMPETPPTAVKRPVHRTKGAIDGLARTPSVTPPEELISFSARRKAAVGRPRGRVINDFGSSRSSR